MKKKMKKMIKKMKNVKINLEKLWNDTMLFDDETKLTKCKYYDVDFFKLLKEMTVGRWIKFIVVDSIETVELIKNVSSTFDENMGWMIYFHSENYDYKVDVTYNITIYDYKKGKIAKKLDFYKNAEKFGL